MGGPGGTGKRPSKASGGRRLRTWKSDRRPPVPARRRNMRRADDRNRGAERREQAAQTRTPPNNRRDRMGRPTPRGTTRGDYSRRIAQRDEPHKGGRSAELLNAMNHIRAAGPRRDSIPAQRRCLVRERLLRRDTTSDGLVRERLLRRDTTSMPGAGASAASRHNLGWPRAGAVAYASYVHDVCAVPYADLRLASRVIGRADCRFSGRRTIAAGWLTIVAGGRFWTSLSF